MSRFTTVLKLLPIALLAQTAFALPNLEQAVVTTANTAVTTVDQVGQAVTTTVASAAATIAAPISTLSRLHAVAPYLNMQALQDGLHAYKVANSEHLVKNPLLTVVDYALPSNQQRMWVFNMDTDQLLMKTYVAHGMNSGGKYAKHFSNADNSKESCLGTFLTLGTYDGHHGCSLNIQGLEQGYNNNAYARRIVVHPAKYVAPSFIKANGYAGRSWGCLAVGPKVAPTLIQDIKGGSVIFSYYPSANYLDHSLYA